jgi:hypothetical protein
MNVTNNPLAVNAERELENELATWDWARAAGVSAADLSEAVQARLAMPEIRQAPLAR